MNDFASYVPDSWTRAGLAQVGYQGFLSFKTLARPAVTTEPGIYVVIRPSPNAPTFAERSPAGKLQDPTESHDLLRDEWVDGAQVVYIGKATWGTRRDGIWRRLKQYRRTGDGRADNHMGGVWIWQLEDADDLLVCWIAAKDRSDEFVHSLERHLIADFKSHFGRRPFANRTD